MNQAERAEAYRETARTAWADGILSADERRMLTTLRERLGIDAHEAERLEEQAMPTANRPEKLLA